MAFCGPLALLGLLSGCAASGGATPTSAAVSNAAPGAPKPITMPRGSRKAQAATGAQAAAPADAGAQGLTPKIIADTLAEMAAAVQRGDHERALALGDQILQKQPPPEAREQIERLRKVAKQHLLQSFYIDAVVRASKDRVVIGEPIIGEVVLVNVGTESVIIEDEAQGAPSGSASRTLLHLEVSYREFVPDGTQVHEILSSNVIIGKRITIPRGQRHSIPLKLDTLEQNPSGTMLRQYDIGGTVFLAALQAGKETIYGQLQLKSHQVRVFPRNYEHLADHPLARLEDAIRRRSPDHIPLAAALVPEDQRKDALAVLRAGLREGASTSADLATKKACCVALTVITGEDLKPEPEEWLVRLDELLK